MGGGNSRELTGTTSGCGVKQIERDPNTRTARTDPWSIGRGIPVKPWCTGKQLPLGFNPMDLGSVENRTLGPTGQDQCASANRMLLACTGPLAS